MNPKNCVAAGSAESGRGAECGRCRGEFTRCCCCGTCERGATANDSSSPSHRCPGRSSFQQRWLPTIVDLSELCKHSLLITQEGRRNCSTGFTQLSFQGLSDICFKESAVRVVLIAQRPVPALDILREVAVLIGFAVKDVKVSLFLP